MLKRSWEQSARWKDLADEYIADRVPEDVQAALREHVFGCPCCEYSPGLRKAGEKHGVCHMRLHRWSGKLQAHMQAAEKLGHA